MITAETLRAKQTEMLAAQQAERTEKALAIVDTVLDRLFKEVSATQTNAYISWPNSNLAEEYMEEIKAEFSKRGFSLEKETSPFPRLKW